MVQHWREPDHGIWEIRGAPARYTHSLVTAASGLEGAAALADQRVVSGDADVWRRTAAAIAGDIGMTGGPLEIRLDGGGADAALAQAALLGGLDFVAARIGPHPRPDRRTARPWRSHRSPREPRRTRLADPCAPFVFPTFWLAAALAATGRDGSRWLERRAGDTRDRSDSSARSPIPHRSLSAGQLPAGPEPRGLRARRGSGDGTS